MIRAAFMTAFWGGPAGVRPLFVITSDDGRGAGKSALALVISRLCGGHIDVSCSGEIDKLKTRLLSADARTTRIVMVDNVKSLRLSVAEIEAMITAPVISGHKMFHGEGQRPNLLTWFMTFNGVSMATDMAQRSVIIKIKRAEYKGPWLEETLKYVDQFRNEIIGDIIAGLQSEPVLLTNFSRWATWEQAVLSRVPDPAEAQRVMRERQNEANVELDKAEIVEEYFANELARFGYDPDTMEVRIPVSTAADWFKVATGDTRMSTTSANKRLRQMIGEGQVKLVSDDPGRTYGRCFIWSGANADPFKDTANDLKERIEDARITSSRWR